MQSISVDPHPIRPSSTLYPRRAKRILDWCRSGLGCFIAIIAAEVGLRVIASPSAGESRGLQTVVRQYDEGFSSATFGPDGRRLTGNPTLPNASIGLILGDSHVEALQVDDSATMGSVLERRLRKAGVRINVLQYGLSGQAAPAYCAVAPYLLQRRGPTWVIVLLNREDFGDEAFSGPFRFTLAATGESSLIAEEQWTYFGPASLAPRNNKGVQRALRHSVLATQLFRKLKVIAFSKGPYLNEVDSKTKLTAAASVRQLKLAYGGQDLMVAYDPETAPSDPPRTDPVEEAFLHACEKLQVTCRTLGPVLNGQGLVRGFYNTQPNIGHYNRHGHELIGNALYSEVSRLMVRN